MLSRGIDIENKSYQTKNNIIDFYHINTFIYTKRLHEIKRGRSKY